MGTEIGIYALIVAAFLAFAWTFASRREETTPGYSQLPGWKKMPGVFKFTWSFAQLFEKTAGGRFGAIFPKKREEYDADGLASALPLDAKKVFASAFALLLLFGATGAGIGCAIWVARPDVWIGYSFLPPVLLGALGWIVPGFTLQRYARKRRETLVRELPFAIDLIGAAMRSGLDFSAALRYFVANGNDGPLKEEFGQVLTETTLGKPFAQSLTDMAQRVGVEAFASFAGVVSYGAEVGAPITKTLKIHGEDLRRERFHLAERKAARAPAIMIIPLVLFLMPAVFIIVLTPMFMRMGRVFAH